MTSEYYDLSNAYALFCSLASICSLWAMQRVTPDANIHTWIGKIKWCHRASIALVSMVFLLAATDTLYYGTQPRVVDFLLIFMLLLVLVLSVMRHMVSPSLGKRDHSYYWNPRV